MSVQVESAFSFNTAKGTCKSHFVVKMYLTLFHSFCSDMIALVKKPIQAFVVMIFIEF